MQSLPERPLKQTMWTIAPGVCHAPSVTGLAACFGSGAATNSFNQIEDADVLFIIGSIPLRLIQ